MAPRAVEQDLQGCDYGLPVQSFCTECKVVVSLLGGRSIGMHPTFDQLVKDFVNDVGDSFELPWDREIQFLMRNSGEQIHMTEEGAAVQSLGLNNGDVLTAVIGSSLAYKEAERKVEIYKTHIYGWTGHSDCSGHGLAGCHCANVCSSARALADVPAEISAPLLVSVLQSNKHPTAPKISHCREQAAAVLVQLGAPALPFALPVLIEALDDTDSWVQVHAVRALGNVGVGSEAQSVAPSIGALLPGSDLKLSLAVITALGNFGPISSPFAEAISKHLDSSSWKVVAAAAECLGKLGPSSAPYVRKLRRLSHTPHEHSTATMAIHAAATEALARLGATAEATYGDLLPFFWRLSRA